MRILKFVLCCIKTEEDKKPAEPVKSQSKAEVITEEYDPQLQEADKLIIVRESMRGHIENIKNQSSKVKSKTQKVRYIEQIPIYQCENGKLVDAGGSYEYVHTEDFSLNHSKTI